VVELDAMCLQSAKSSKKPRGRFTYYGKMNKERWNLKLGQGLVDQVCLISYHNYRCLVTYIYARDVMD